MCPLIAGSWTREGRSTSQLSHQLSDRGGGPSRNTEPPDACSVARPSSTPRGTVQPYLLDHNLDWGLSPRLTVTHSSQGALSASNTT